VIETVTVTLGRPAVAIALPDAECEAVSVHLDEAGFEPVRVKSREELSSLLTSRTDVGVAILDGEKDLDRTLEMYAELHEGARSVPALIVVAAGTLDRFALAGPAHANDEYFTRPYSVESLRWRVEAMLIRAGVSTIDAGAAVLDADASLGRFMDHSRRGRIIVVFNPKGGVGKTTIAVNLAAALQIRRSQHVLLVDCDIVTGHVASSLGMENVRTVSDAWNEDSEGAVEGFGSVAATHPNGVSVVVLADSPLHTEVLEPRRVADAITASTRQYDFVVVDLHPDYGRLNQIIFERADRIVVPVTPDVPAIRAAVQFREVAVELGIRDRLAMVVNRANSGVSVADMERTVGLPALAEVRSAGMLFVRAANEGRSAVERFPREKVIDDIDALAGRLLSGEESGAAKAGNSFLSIFGSRAKASLRAS
jgi:MinD-like ATPase involved in chromosome partitioning or flagellar assembly